MENCPEVVTFVEGDSSEGLMKLLCLDLLSVKCIALSLRFRVFDQKYQQRISVWVVSFHVLKEKKNNKLMHRMQLQKGDL